MVITILKGDQKLTGDEVEVLDSPFIRRLDSFFSNDTRIKQLQAFLKDRGHKLTLSEIQAFFQVARENAIAEFDHETFEEMQTYKDDHPDQIANSAQAAFKGNQELLANYQAIYQSFLAFWMAERSRLAS